MAARKGPLPGDPLAATGGGGKQLRLPGSWPVAGGSSPQPGLPAAGTPTAHTHTPARLGPHLCTSTPEVGVRWDPKQGL